MSSSNSAKGRGNVNLISNFFSKLTSEEYESQKRKESAIDKAQWEFEKNKLEIRRKKHAAELLDIQRRSVGGSQLVSIDDESHKVVVGDEVLHLVEQNDEIDVDKVTRKYKKRSSNWRVVAHKYLESKNLLSIMTTYGADIGGNSMTSKARTISRWVTDLVNERNSGIMYTPSYGRASPVYGLEIDILLKDMVMIRLQAGVPTDNFGLSQLLHEVLLSRSYGSIIEKWQRGDYVFGNSWANRFWTRHNLASRVSTTKMRELPADFEEKDLKYLLIYSFLIHYYDIPDELITGCDETNVQLVPTIKRARAPEGQRKIRVIGIGKDKLQITSTLGACATGDMLDKQQLIFGGSTNRCHPNKGRTDAPDDLFYDHTSSHWQNPVTYVNYLKVAVVPHRLKMIEKLGLPATQKALHKHDMHYSHFDQKVLDFLKENHIVPLYVNPNHTEIRQEADVVENKPFKSSMVRCFRNYLNQKHHEYMAENAGVPILDRVPFQVSNLVVNIIYDSNPFILHYLFSHGYFYRSI